MANVIGNASIVYVDSSIQTKITGLVSSDSGKITTDGSGGLTVIKLSSDGGLITTDGAGSLNAKNIVTTGTITGAMLPSTIKIPSKKFADLETTAQVGDSYIVTDALKPGETTGAGTGVLCYYDGTNWINSASGTTVVS